MLTVNAVMHEKDFRGPSYSSALSVEPLLACQGLVGVHVKRKDSRDGFYSYT